MFSGTSWRAPNYLLLKVLYQHQEALQKDQAQAKAQYHMELLKPKAFSFC